VSGHLVAPRFRELPLGSVRPAGWLEEQLRLQADGLTGHLEELWADVGPDSAWLGGSGEDWERGPYYLDGLVPLAHLTGDAALMDRASHWVDRIVSSQAADGQFGPRSNDDWWPRMVALKALTQHHEATGDERIIGFLERYFAFQRARLRERRLRDWGRVRGADNVLSVYWLYERTADAGLVDLADLLLEQTADWGAWLAELPAREVTRTWDHMTHVVNVAMGLKTPAVRSMRGGDPAHRRALDEGLRNLDRSHGQVHGFFSGDEWLAGTDARRGTELCAVVEAMYSFETLVRIWGDAAHGDRLENLGYNLLPATLDARMTAHQYHQQANQVLATIDQRDWTQAGDDCLIFGLEPNFGCCTANLHQGWPMLVRSMWLTLADRPGLAAIVHGPCSVSTELDGQRVTVDVETDYPFDERVGYTVSAAGPARFALDIRIPAWCEAPELTIAGEAAQSPATVRDGFLRVERTWRDGDGVDLRLPMRVRAQLRPRGGVGVSLGPLRLAFSPGEVWTRLPGSAGFGDWEVRPRRSWNMALAIEPASVDGVASVERLGVTSPPFGLETGSPPFGVSGVPVKVWLPGRRAPSWRLVDASAP
jgi:hypothetical protein